jgi:hypothetical protein
MYLIWSFDTEDYITPQADDALLEWAKLLTRHDVIGTFCMVAEKARQLRARNRDDVIDALRLHRIAYHSNWHSRHPVYTEYLNECGWDDGVAEVEKRESDGIRDVAEIMGRFPCADVPPGKSWGPQVIAAMKKMGIRISAGAYVVDKGRAPASYCGGMTLRYGMAMEDIFNQDDPLRAAQELFTKTAEETDSKHGVIIPFSHPCMAVTDRFWDGLNFANGQNPPPEEWKPAPLRKAGESERFFAFVDEFLGWLKSQGGLEWTTYSRLLEKYPLGRPVAVTLDAVLKMAEQCRERVDYVDLGVDTYTAAAVLTMLVRTYVGGRKDGKLPVQIPHASPLGPIEDPPLQSEGGELDIGELLPALVIYNEELANDRPMPASINVNGITLSPSDLIMTLAEGIISWAVRGRIPERLPIKRGPMFPEIINTLKDTRKPFVFNKEWPIFADDFQGENVAAMARRMVWSYRPLKRARE